MAALPTKRVRRKADGHEVTINASDFNHELHVDLAQEAADAVAPGAAAGGKPKATKPRARKPGAAKAKGDVSEAAGE